MDELVTSILVADDHPIVREGIVGVLNRAPDYECVAQASGVEEAIDAWRQFRPDVGLFDLRMADGDAVGAITRIRQFDPEARIIVLSSFDGEEEVFRVMKAGARGYVLKDSPAQDILLAISTVVFGKRFLPPALAEKLAVRVSANDLSPREVEILLLAASGKKNARIAEELSVSLSTIKYHLINVYSKLGVSSRTEAISVAVKRGIIAIG
ncbi:MAG: response regulator transcription factor [Pseudomonadota bacterium]